MHSTLTTYGVLFCCALFISAVCTQDSLGLLKTTGSPKKSPYGNRPRGVPYARAVLYSTGETFACVDNSLTIPFNKVNDDYCDCSDGSDEPGTSACANGKFHCLNRGHEAIDIPSGRVNDQICDCCDGSDEWHSAVECPNICEELGAKRREDHRIRIELVAKGFEKRKLLAAEALKVRAEKEVEIKQLVAEKDALSATKDKANAKKTEIEAKESEAKKKQDDAWNEVKNQKKRAKAQELFIKIDSNKDDKIDMNDLKSFEELDLSMQNSATEDEVKRLFGDKEGCDFETFFNEIYDQLKIIITTYRRAKDHAKEAEKSAEEVKTDKTADDTNIKNKNDENKLGEATMKENEGDVGSEEFQSEDDGNEADQGSEVEDVETGTPIILEDNDRDDEFGDDEPQPSYDDETKKLIAEADEARKEYDEITTKLAEVESKLQNGESYVNGDYGPDLAWLPLKEQCFSLDERQYTYSVCLFDHAEQKEKNSHSSIRLGSWRDWAGQEGDKYAVQKYDKGLQCWNGPERSVMVYFECAEETKLIEATEPAKCEYRMVLQSPAACPDPASIPDMHEEL